jgi:hypothetical protein
LFAGVVAAEAMDTNDRVEAGMREAYASVAAVVAELLGRALEHPQKVDLDCTAQMFIGLYMGGLMHQRLFRAEYSLDRTLPVLERMLAAAAFSEADDEQPQPAQPTRARRTRSR